MGIREDRLGRAAKESAFNSLDLYLSAGGMEIIYVAVAAAWYRGQVSREDRAGLDAIKI